jgi:elongation factor G
MAGSGWLVELAIEPVPVAWDSVQTALGLVGRHLDLEVRADATVRQVVLRARTEEHVRSATLYLQAAVPDGCRFGATQVAYRATPAKPAEATYVHKQQSGGSGEFASVTLRLVPGERGSGFQFLDEDVRRNIPARWVPSIEKGIRDVVDSGDPFGDPLTDFAVHLIDGRYHDLDSSPIAFERAGAGAMRQAAGGAGFILLEPIVRVAVLTPERCLAEILAELERRNAAIDEVKSDGTRVVLAIARMVDMLGFEVALSAASDGCARSAIVLHGYAEMHSGGGPDDSYPMAAALRA